MTDELRKQLESQPTGELVEILRNQDTEEWRPEVFPLVEAILLARGVDVAAWKEAGPPARDGVEFAPIESVATFSTTLEASLCRMALVESGIKAWLSTEHLVGVVPPLGAALGVDVLVRREDAGAAREVLADIDAGGATLKDDAE